MFCDCKARDECARFLCMGGGWSIEAAANSMALGLYCIGAAHLDPCAMDCTFGFLF